MADIKIFLYSSYLLFTFHNTNMFNYLLFETQYFFIFFHRTTESEHLWKTIFYSLKNIILNSLLHFHFSSFLLQTYYVVKYKYTFKVENVRRYFKLGIQ